MLSLFARERKQRLDQTLALSTAYRGTALLLGDVVEADDHYTGLHSRDVVDLSVAVADELGLDATQRRNVEFAALLHDVGKIRVPKNIINKPGKLDERRVGDHAPAHDRGRDDAEAGRRHCSRASVVSSAPPMSASTGSAIPTGSSASRSRSSRGSSARATPTAR